MKLVDPVKVFGSSLNSIQSPSRYIGGEFGITVKNHVEGESTFNFAVAFPDLYEIAMSNLAVKIIYNGLNAIEGVRCERVFAPDTDLEAMLREKDVPLWTLETGMPLCETDMVSFSIGYELGITEVLAMLDTGKIPLLSSERTENDPIVIAGGCGVTNPAPLSDFFDAIIVGEAEPALFDLVRELSDMKKNGASRAQMISHMESKPFVWTKNSCSDGKKTARRAVQNNFGLVPSVPSWFPLPTNKPVQDHGVIEIMRGCPNGCRFCHAGIYYRPMRVKNLNLIIDEIDHLVFDAGYREISLNSLSSADFPDVAGLLDILNDRYKGYNVSFQLPSLKVNSMSLDILEKLSQVRKSGLTFAVETPEEMWQLSLNKEVYAQHLESIIREAKARGWSSAKFYFMVGLPLGDYFGDGEGQISEEKAIVDFLIPLQARTKIQCNVNVGVFIPKPHTPYERVRQITPEKAKEKIEYLWQNLPRGKFKIGRHNYDSTIIEGILSRGDQRTGKVILDAYKNGARFDAWDEHLRENMKFWNAAFDNADFDVMDWIFREWDEDEVLPWNGISLGVSPTFYKKEWQKSVDNVLTPRCEADCTHKCGICNKKEDVKVYTKELVESVSGSIKNKTIVRPEIMPESNIEVLQRVIFSFTRKDGGEFTPYISQVEIFHKAILRTGLQFVFTAGFNPLPRLEFATAMTLGIPSHDEIASCLLYEPMDPAELKKKMNESLPVNLQIKDVYIFPVTNMRKRESLAKCLWGGIYSYEFFSDGDRAAVMESDKVKELLSSKGYGSEEISGALRVKCPVSDKAFRTLIEEITQKRWFDVVKVEKVKTLAKNDISGWTAQDEENWRNDSKNFTKAEEASEKSEESIDFFDLFRQIAVVNADLIKKRAELKVIEDQFYSEHPELAERRKKKPSS